MNLDCTNNLFLLLLLSFRCQKLQLHLNAVMHLHHEMLQQLLMQTDSLTIPTVKLNSELLNAAPQMRPNDLFLDGSALGLASVAFACPFALAFACLFTLFTAGCGTVSGSTSCFVPGGIAFSTSCFMPGGIAFSTSCFEPGGIAFAVREANNLLCLMTEGGTLDKHMINRLK